MLTRLRVKGFKNLVDLEVYFGPFTCIAGGNAVGKSNLFDAIRFLSLLARGRLDEAGRAIRAEEAGNADIRSLFTRNSDGAIGFIEFDLDMIVPQTAQDDLGQHAKGKASFLNYKLKLGYRDDLDARRQFGELEVLSEELAPITAKKAHKHIGFDFSPDWLKSVVHGSRTQSLISSATNKEGVMEVRLHQDGEYLARTYKRQRYIHRPAQQMPRTFLSVADADSPTMLCARSEMRKWEMVQLEPSAMRESDLLHQSPGISASGAHMPATLYELARVPWKVGAKPDPEAVYQRIGNRLSELIGDVGAVRVDVDRKREMLAMHLQDAHGAATPARSLSDGTLCFIALLLKQMESEPQRLLCMEEPENGIHPKRISAMINLLIETAVDTSAAVDESNPLRQVIINTHSPAVVQQVPHDTLLVAELRPWRDSSGQSGSRLACLPLAETWRTKRAPQVSTIQKGALLSYLRPARPRLDLREGTRRVIDRKDLQQLVLGL